MGETADSRTLLVTMHIALTDRGEVWGGAERNKSPTFT